MKLSYQMTLEDTLEFHVYHASHSTAVQKQRQQQRIFFSVVFLAFGAVFFLRGQWLAGSIVTTLACVWFTCMPALLRVRTRKYFRKQLAESIGDSLRTPIEAEIQDQGIHFKNHICETLYGYSAIGKIVESGIYTFLYIDKGSAIVLASDRLRKDQIDAFVERVKERKLAALES
jgi:YcxB-like protein